MALQPGEISRILKRHRYNDIKVIGEGSFGKAVLVEAEDGSKLVCKMVNVSQASPKETQDAVKEGRLLAAFRHPFIVQYRENFIENGWLCILMAFCEGGDLTSQIEVAKNARQHIPEEQILRWMTQALLALKYIHDRHVLHRDLKSSNFFISSGGNLKMGDFGIAKVLTCTAACAKTLIGTPNYLSPEVCQEQPYTWPSDIWAMGCILYELCALKLPFEAPNLMVLVQRIVRDPLPTIPRGYSEFVVRMFGEMLNRNPKLRPSAGTILHRPRIQGFIKEMMDQASAAAQDPKAGDNAGGAAADQRRKGELVEYYSESHGSWIPAIVLSVDGEGRVELDVKPNIWITKEQQGQKLRPRAVEAAPEPARDEQPVNPYERGTADAVKKLDAGGEGVRNGAAGAGQGLGGDDEFSRLCEELGIDDELGLPAASREPIASVPEEVEVAHVGAGVDSVGVDLIAAGEAVLEQQHSPSSCSLTLAELELLADMDN